MGLSVMTKFVFVIGVLNAVSAVGSVMFARKIASSQEVRRTELMSWADAAMSLIISVWAFYLLVQGGAK